MRIVFFVALAIIGVCLCAALFLGGASTGQYFERKEAMNAGAASYEFDPNTGGVMFVYKTLVKQDSQTNE